MGAKPKHSGDQDISQQSGKVKWYSDRKGYGFIDIDGEEAFIHRTILLGFGLVRIQNEDIITALLSRSERGLVVEQITAIERPPLPANLLATEAADGEYFAEVKFFNDEKGYGFLTVDGFDEDVFIHSRLLEETGMPKLESGQPLLVRVEPGNDGHQVATIRLFVGGRNHP